MPTRSCSKARWWMVQRLRPFVTAAAPGSIADDVQPASRRLLLLEPAIASESVCGRTRPRKSPGRRTATCRTRSDVRARRRDAVADRFPSDLRMMTSEVPCARTRSSETTGGRRKPEQALVRAALPLFRSQRLLRRVVAGAGDAVARLRCESRRSNGAPEETGRATFAVARLAGPRRVGVEPCWRRGVYPDGVDRRIEQFFNGRDGLIRAGCGQERWAPVP